jgi:ribose-phosphate pyrophosphokinase
MDGVVLLADPKSKAWDFAVKIRDYLQLKGESTPLWEVSIMPFNNKEIDMYVPENIRKKHVYFIHDSAKNPQQWWIEILLLKDLVLSASAESLTFVLPNMLYSRKDRKDKSRVPISARALARTISPNLKRIITMDLHAPQIQGFYPENTPLDNLYSFPEVARYLLQKHGNEFEKLVVVSPDAGGVHRAKSFLRKLEKYNYDSPDKKEFSFAMINKTRPKSGEIENMQLVGDVLNKDVLIVDDIIDTGGTLCKAAELLKKQGAGKIFCYATHGLFTKGTQELVSCFDRVMTSNTHYRDENELENVEIIDVSSLFAEAIYRAQKGFSVSSLFE